MEGGGRRGGGGGMEWGWGGEGAVLFDRFDLFCWTTVIFNN